MERGISFKERKKKKKRKKEKTVEKTGTEDARIGVTGEIDQRNRAHGGRRGKMSRGGGGCAKEG